MAVGWAVQSLYGIGRFLSLLDGNSFSILIQSDAIGLKCQFFIVNIARADQLKGINIVMHCDI